MRRWLDTRADLNLARTGTGRAGPTGCHVLFCILHGRPMATSFVRILLKRLARQAGVEKRVHAHGLRHTDAAQLRAEGIDIAIISKRLGHASVTTTARCLDHVAPRTGIKATRNRTWTGE